MASGLFASRARSWTGTHHGPQRSDFPTFFVKPSWNWTINCILAAIPLSFRSGDESDGFTITRPGKRGCCGHTLRLQLLRHQSPERFVLSPDLYEVLAPYVKPTHGADDSFVKADISLALWQYIKDKDLMQVDGSRAISNDAAFQRIFECSEQPIHALMGKLQKKLTPVGPVSLEFDLKLDDAHKDEVCLSTKSFSIEVQAEEALLQTQMAALASIAAHRKDTTDELNQLELQMANLVRRINSHVANRSWMAKFAEDPSVFMDQVFASQAADEQILSAAHRESPAHLHDPTVYEQPWVHSTIDMVVARETAL
ncbi:hypothetical protein, variant [Aphanomyces invadans]|uniref:DM2 domain-containing protein n=1 Tax=Aphanomyces invadans TaxID=157072 RepID=A0A024TWL9_9STRA|nr:hypothetical protein, variant [Aphanomyces invadans]ETV97757.1 hypothetical protein, variant [Aphanomyces invadans]|eukprot:XP_008873318.1 hypothetical protein, variant [Aphanomyces invadans]